MEGRAMKNITRTTPLISAFLLAACGGDVAEESLSAEALSRGTVEQAIYEEQTVYMWWHECKYALAATWRSSTFPPVYDITLSRTASSTCVADSTYLGSTYTVGDLRVTATGSSIVAGFSYKDSPSGSASIAVEINHLAESTLDVVRSTELRAYVPYGTATVGLSKLSFSGTWLIAEGAKNGVLPGESGSGSNYSASYPNFLTSGDPPRIYAY
jgi:hypothetical protein